MANYATNAKEMRALNPGSVHWDALAYVLGKSSAELRSLGDEEIDKLIEAKLQRRLEYSPTLRDKMPRGNPLLALGRFLDPRNFKERFDKIFG